MGEAIGKKEEVRGKGTETKQVYLRFVGVRGDAAFESAPSGPWDAVVHGDAIVLGKDDHVELEGEIRDLEIQHQASGLRVQMAEVNPPGSGCVLGEWREIGVSAWNPVEAGTVMSVDELRGKVNRLHAARDGWVKAAREARVVKGMESGNFVEAWEKVESLTEEIAVAEAELERELEADASRPHPPRAALWRDAAKEKPDADIVVLVRLDNEEFRLGIAEYDGENWLEAGEPTACAVRGWMHFDEAAELLDAKPDDAERHTEAADRKPAGPCNAVLKAAMLKTARAFQPDRETIMKALRKVFSGEELLEEAQAVITELTEYGAAAGAEILRRASAGTLAEQLDAVDRAYPMIGAPGDFGYGTARGASWYALLQLAAEVGENGKEADRG